MEILEHNFQWCLSGVKDEANTENEIDLRGGIIHYSYAFTIHYSSSFRFIRKHDGLTKFLKEGNGVLGDERS